MLAPSHLAVGLAGGFVFARRRDRTSAVAVLGGGRLTWRLVTGVRALGVERHLAGAFERKSDLLNLFEHLTRCSQWLRGVVDHPAAADA